MKPVKPKPGIKSLVVALLLMWQVNAHAQTEDTVVSYETISDTVIAPPPVEELEAVEVNPVRTTPRDTLIFRRVPDSVLNEMRRDKEFEYANDPEYWVKEKTEPEDEDPGYSLLSQKWFEVLMIILLSAVLIFAIIKIAVSNNLFLTTGSKKYNTGEDEIISENENIDELITAAEQQGDFRLAVRHRYRKLLKDMDARQLIKLDAKKTNWDYVNSLGNHPLKKQFLLLTRAYEYVWYGEFEINGEQYGYLKTEFQQFKS